MASKKFEAILSKNNIARELRDFINRNEPMSTTAIIYALKQIEEYLGEDNQPSVEEILTSKFDL